MSPVHKIEKENLEAHVTICEQRYDYLVKRMDSLESGLKNLGDELSTLSEKIDRHSAVESARSEQLYRYVITALVATTGFFAAQFFLTL